MTKHDKKRIVLVKKAARLAIVAEKLSRDIKKLAEQAEDGYIDEVDARNGSYNNGWTPMRQDMMWQAAKGIAEGLKYSVSLNTEFK